MKKLCVISLSILLAGLLVSGKHAALAAANAHPIKIGAILILSGSEAMYGHAFQRGIELATEEINSSGGVDGRPIEVIYEDSGNKPKDSYNAAIKLITRDKITAAVNSSFTEVMANGALFERSEIPAITLWDTATQIEQLGDYIFGIGVYTPSAGSVSAQFSRKTLKAKTCVIINMHNEWGNTVSEIFKEEFSTDGGTVLKTFSLDPSTTDFRSIIVSTKALKPDMIYTPLVEGVIPFYTQLKQLGFSSYVVTSDIISDQHIQESPAAFEGIYQSQPADPNNAESIHLQSRYKERYGEESTMILFNAWGYDSIKLYAEAINRAGDSPQAIKDELYRIKNFPGASGSIRFNSKGSSPTLEHMFQIQGGEFVLIQ